MSKSDDEKAALQSQGGVGSLAGGARWNKSASDFY